jgi:hypothetical protein
MLSLPEIQRLQLPQAILIGVQKGGTTASYNYLDQHPDITESTKELYFLDEHVKKLVVKRNGSIPQLQGRQAYSTVMMQAQTQPERDYGKMVLDLMPNYIEYV